MFANEWFSADIANSQALFDSRHYQRTGPLAPVPWVA